MKTRNRILLGLAAVIAVGLSALAIAMSYETPCGAAPPLAAGETSMRAVMHRCYGPPGALRVERVARPKPKEGQLLVKVRAAGLNPFEWHMTTGTPYLVRFFTGFGKPASPRLGSDFAGVIDAVGPGVTRFKAGDEVFGNGGGALAEYMLVRAAGEVLLKPAELSFDEAAAIPIAAVTALQGLRDHGHVSKGQKVLINGASGGVGTYAIQIAKSFGAEVTAVCSTRNLALVSSLGADHVIDYTKEDFTRGAARYDVILDTVGNHDQAELRGVLGPTGTLVGVGGNKNELWIGPIVGMIKWKVAGAFTDQHLEGFIADMNTPDLEFLARLAREGKLKSVVDKRYSLEETPAALDYIGGRHARGKVIVSLD